MFTLACKRQILKTFADLYKHMDQDEADSTKDRLFISKTVGIELTNICNILKKKENNNVPCKQFKQVNKNV